MTDILDTAALAELLRTPVHTVHYWRARGTGPRGTKVGKRVLYLRSDVDAWLQEKAAADPMSSRSPDRKAS